MDRCLRYLAEHLGVLYRDYGFRIVDSRYSKSFGNGYLVLETGHLRAILVSDRGQLMLSFAGKGTGGWSDWVDHAAVEDLLAGTTGHAGVLPDDDTPGIVDLLPEIVAAFAPSALPDTLKRLEQLKTERADRLFGPLP